MKKQLCLIIALVMLAGFISVSPAAAAESSGASARFAVKPAVVLADLEDQPEDTVLGTLMDTLTLWKEAYEGSKSLGDFEAGQTVYVFYRLGDFYYVQIPGTGMTGYMLVDLVEVQDEVPVEEPTPEPTEEPTPEPTEEPTPEPTEEPTPEPTEEPTPEPTEEPTPEPTEEPTPEPTEEPTPEPTEEPTPEPTEEPTPEPTEEPTPEPTEEPTPEPTEEPTPEPTEEPEPEPTEEPGPEPTAEPTSAPTEGPTAEPTSAPSEGPTEGPTAEPTEEPGPEPTEEPTPAPTEGPTAEPTEEPTPLPTATPTPAPTADPNRPDGTVRGTIIAGTLPLRDTPGVTGKSLGLFYDGQVVYIYHLEGDYYYLMVAGTDMKGYMPALFIDAEGEVPQKDEPTPAPTATPSPTPSGPYTEPTQQMIDNAVDGVLIKSGVNMRKGPGTKYGLADSNLKSGLQLTVYLQDGDWYFLKVDKTGKYGYIYKSYVELEPEPTPSGPYTEPTKKMIENAVDGILVKSGVNMRKGPGTNYGLVDSNLKSGTQLTVYLHDGDWYFLKVDKTGKYGYIYEDYVELDDVEPTAKATKKPAEDDEPSVYLSQGDVNGDGLISAADVALILRYDAGLIDLSDAQLAAADMDGDDQVTSMDAKSLLKYVTNRLAR